MMRMKRKLEAVTANPEKTARQRPRGTLTVSYHLMLRFKLCPNWPAWQEWLLSPRWTGRRIESRQFYSQILLLFTAVCCDSIRKRGCFFFCLRSGPVSKCWPFSLLITLLIVNFVVIVLVLKKYWSFKYRATIYIFLNAVFTQTLSRRVDWFWGFFLRGWAAPCCFNSRGWRSGVVSEKDPEENWLGLWRSCCKILDAFCRFSLEQGI